MNSEQFARPGDKIQSDTAASAAADILYGDLQSAKINASEERHHQHSELGTPSLTLSSEVPLGNTSPTNRVMMIFSMPCRVFGASRAENARLSPTLMLCA